MALSAEQRNIGEVYQNAPTFTNVNQYVEPLRATVEWWDLPKLNQLHYFSSWNPKGIGISNHIPITELSVTPPGVSDTGSFYFRVWDTDKVINPLTVRRKGIVIIKARQYEAAAADINMMYGFVQDVRTQHEGTQLYYVVSGLGSGVLMNERYINLQRSARMKSIDSTTPIFNDEAMQVRKLYKEILSNKDLYVIDDVAIANQINPKMDMTPLDLSRVKSSLITINEPYVQVSHALNVLLDSVGADGGIDAYNKPYLNYPTSQVSGIVLKHWDTVAESGFDKSASTSYFMEDWDWHISWSKESGFANRLLAKSRVTSTGSSTTSTTGEYAGFANLADTDRAQRIPASPARFRDISIIVSRRGAGTVNPNTKTLHGHIHQDLGNSPGIKVADFDIPLTSIPEDTPTPMFLTGLRFLRQIDPSSAHWITLYERGDFEDNTINWYYTINPTNTGTNAARPRVPGSPWTRDHESSSGWEVSLNNSFDFAYSILDNFTHIIIAEDVDSQQRYGLVEDLVDVSFATNTVAASKYVGELLNIRALPKISFNPNKVTIPGNLFLPGIVVSIEAKQSDIRLADSQIAEVTQATYSFGGGGGDSQLGCLFADISLVGHYDYKLVGSDVISFRDE